MATTLSTQADSALVAAAAAGDEQASGELFRRHHDAVLRYARGLVRDQHLAEDLASEAFTRTLTVLRQGRGPRGAARPYLYTVVRNTAVDWARAGRRTVVTDEVIGWADGTAEADDAPGDGELTAVARAFRELPERWQTVLWYTVIEEEPVQRVAEILGMLPGSVSQLAFRAREGLRQGFLAESVGTRPECAAYTSQLAASLRRPSRRRPRSLRQHLESCPHCQGASEEMTDINGRLRRALPLGFVMLGGAPAHAVSAAKWLVPAGAAAAAAGMVFAVVQMSTGPGQGPSPSRTAAAAPPPAVTSQAATANPEAQRGEAVAPGTGRTPKKADGGTVTIRSSTLLSCLEPNGTSVIQRSCLDAAARWRRTDSGDGFTLASASTGKCMARGDSQLGVPWEGGSAFAVTLAPCGGAGQVWKLVQFTPGVTRLMNGDGYYLQASWSGLQPVSLKPFSAAGVAAQGWAVAQV